MCAGLDRRKTKGKTAPGIKQDIVEARKAEATAVRDTEIKEQCKARDRKHCWSY